ncbi:bifunctional [glutamate--ammonia ligase]-adenylyl-L-tyrosine phosphorylase/[glutamate--ammonia-ligase] adenylyltransferase [Denitratisoma oestradiolicum]|uniref:Bifunctional glutamine synthetase adenylyltransferase/adenylyl-removing enzyme n=1 Tax=Denitratisoma oestradiolicum TaxID=311182 RepID=A0A6S6XY39_9PROT|nr:bifunctional [glutamate--ammonia ligase]-adenylyl-L-tyrosine phosphorylase/[glutamate--ammonia-ligase] adenylyltransferase [Denitratisoma oestradiolicum]TWO81109.1 bifunctional glutamine synthetase adenylyltransferase/deadenyltransferase [Denitratisoma oestradiolicum]CAB1367789.1 Glutamine synthetase adenylyl-L-tyrosine phosphorylase / Glutamine synthetase adenylyl transferase [Denitratisoma oestradiolicum]
MTALDNVLPYSRYLARLVEARPALEADISRRLGQAPDRVALADHLAAQSLTEDSLKPALRHFKQWAYAWVGLRDLAGLAPLEEVTETMTLIADLAVAKALEVIGTGLEARYGAPRNARGEHQQLIVIGMGKLGGRELNVSSDIDLIFVYPDDGETDGERVISNFEFFSRLGRQLISAIAEVTGDGQVFRVDMRLRPNGDSGPLVCSFEMLENYFITQGREWERYAWIKARPMTGQRWEELEAIRRPFVFRKYLDFGAINAMRDLHAQIRREVAKKDMANHIKLGPGGIREIEFIAQVFQLIRGGRDRPLQIKPTLHVLPLLAERGILSLAGAQELAAAYRFLRRLEHRLQYLDDAQTHRLPDKSEDQDLVARAKGYVCYQALLAELDAHRETVSQHFEAVFADPNRDGHDLDRLWQGAGERAVEAFASLGFREPEAAAERLAALHAGGRYRQMAQGIRERFDALVPRALAAAAALPNPDETLTRLLDLLEAVSRRAAYLALLQQYPQALGKVAQLMGSSSWAAQYLQQHPILLDELLDARLLDTPQDWVGFRAELEQRLEEVEPDTERQMDLLREAHHAQVFRLLTQDISGLLQLEKLSDHLSELADIMVDKALRFAWKKLATRHRDAPKFAVISYGKLGGKELGYASDLDMVYLFEDEDPDAGRIYSRLATRLSTWLSAQTPAGMLFETDLRLRPNGDSGLPVVSLDSFRQYQLENAWPWEHQALTRARFSAGDKAVGEKFEQIRIEILRQKRDPEKLREDVLAMRQRMYDAHATKGDEVEHLFNLKQDPGGLIDVEFLVQYLVLGHAHVHPELCGNLGNIALLRIAAGLGLIPAERAETVRDAYREYRRLQHALRLNNQKSRVERISVLPQIEAVCGLWRVVFDR